jgi:hypothetical protein
MTITVTDRGKIADAWRKEKTGRLPADDAVQSALVPAGGDWQCVVNDGAITRTIGWRGTEVALVNPRGDLTDRVEGQIAMALRAAPVMDKALRVIAVLAKDPDNLDLIARVASSAIDIVEQPAPRVPEPEDDEAEGDAAEDEPAF